MQASSKSFMVILFNSKRFLLKYLAIFIFAENKANQEKDNQMFFNGDLVY